MGQPDDDPYERLRVAPTASAEEIRRAYLELVAKIHPDQHQGNPLEELAREELARVNLAYEVLSDPGRRAAHDARRRSGAEPGSPRRGAPAPPTPGPDGQARAGGGLSSWARLAIGLGLLVVSLRLVLRTGALLLALLGRGLRGLLAATRGTPYRLVALVLVVIVLVAGVRAVRRARRRR